MGVGPIDCDLHPTVPAMSAPADEDIAVYKVKAEGDDLLVQIP